MKTFYIFALFFASFWQVNAQYCIPDFPSTCTDGDQIDSFTIGTAGFSDPNTGCSPTSYSDFFATKTITLSASVIYSFTVTHGYTSQQVRIWADFNNDNTFDEATELIGSGSSGGTYATTSTIQVPVTVAPGNYRLRVADRYSSAPIPCNVDGYGEAHDYKLTVTAAPACVTPSALAASSFTATTATMTWTAPPSAPANGYEIYYSTTATAPTSTTAPTIPSISGTTTNLTGLLPATVYYVYVRSKCSSTEYSAWSVPVSFLTNCVPVTAFTENFDTTTTDLPVCWEKIGTTGYVYVDTGTFASAPNLLYLEGSTFSGTALVKLRPVSTLQLGIYRLKFKLRAAYTAGGKMEVGYLATTGDPASFVGLDSFTASSTTVADNAVVNAIYAPPGVENLYFRQTEVPGEAVFIDDVVYELTPTCAEPANLVSSNGTLTSVTLSWNAPLSAPANGYDIYYSTSGTAPTAATVPTTTANVTSKDLTGLTGNTQYYAWVRSNCSSTDKSPWQPIPFYTGHCIPSGGITSTSYYLNNITTTGGFTNINYTASTFTAYVNNSAALLSTAPGAVINYNLAPSAGTNYFYIWIDYNNDLDFNDAGETILATTSYTSSASGSFTVPASTAPGNYRIRFAQSYIGAITPCGPAEYGGYVDYTLSVGAAPTCIAPTAVTVAAVTSTSATVNWVASTTPPAGGYDVFYSTSSTPPTAVATPNINVAGLNVTLTGLTPATTYWVWVRSRCSSADQSAWSIAAKFTTACVPAAVPFAESFTGGTIPNCWTNFSTNNTSTALWLYSGAPGYGATNNGSAPGSYVWVDASTPYTGVHDVTLQSPQINLAGLATPMVQFRWFKNHLTDAAGTLPTYDNNKLTVMVRDVATTTWFTIFTSSTNAATWRTENINLPATYVGKTIELRFIVDKDAAGNGYFYDDLLLDDIQVKQSTLATSEVNTQNNLLTLYPNPFTDIIRISDVKNVVAISVIDLSGRAIKTVKPAREINLGDLTAGMYLIQLKMKDGSVQTVKAIKK